MYGSGNTLHRSVCAVCSYKQQHIVLAHRLKLHHLYATGHTDKHVNTELHNITH